MEVNCEELGMENEELRKGKREKEEVEWRGCGVQTEERERGERGIQTKQKKQKNRGIQT